MKPPGLDKFPKAPYCNQQTLRGPCWYSTSFRLTFSLIWQPTSAWQDFKNTVSLTKYSTITFLLGISFPFSFMCSHSMPSVAVAYKRKSTPKLCSLVKCLPVHTSILEARLTVWDQNTSCFAYPFQSPWEWPILIYCTPFLYLYLPSNHVSI